MVISVLYFGLITLFMISLSLLAAMIVCLLIMLLSEYSIRLATKVTVPMPFHRLFFTACIL